MRHLKYLRFKGGLYFFHIRRNLGSCSKEKISIALDSILGASEGRYSGIEASTLELEGSMEVDPLDFEF